MKEVGIVLIAIGALPGYVTLSSDTSVSVKDYSPTNSYGVQRVNNLGKMNEQQNLVICSCALC